MKTKADPRGGSLDFEHSRNIPWKGLKLVPSGLLPDTADRCDFYAGLDTSGCVDERQLAPRESSHDDVTRQRNVSAGVAENDNFDHSLVRRINTMTYHLRDGAINSRRIGAPLNKVRAVPRCRAARNSTYTRDLCNLITISLRLMMRDSR